MKLIAIEGGGTTWLAAVALDSPENIVERQVFATTKTPADVLGQIRSWIRSHAPFTAIGIASFGPIDGKSSSSTYGYITSTPKPGWANTDVIGLLGMRDEFAGTPFIFDTDVNAPALAEYTLHVQPKGLSSAAYITIGTGVGVGLVINGKTVHGLLHPEAGHVLVKLKEGDAFPGTCPFHGQCVEGMCSTGALSRRAGVNSEDLASLPDTHPVWDDCAYYVAQLCASLVLIVSPEKISIGGGVFNREILYDKVRALVLRILNGYIQNSAVLTETAVKDYIGPSHWGSSAGIVGAAYLAYTAAKKS